MFPHERSLVKKNEGKPFALLGIDFDSSRKDLKAAIEKEKLTWRNWFDGSDGPIARQWNISVIPTFYIVDAHGVIRYKGIHGGSGVQIDKDVQTLLKEMAPEKKEAAASTSKN